MRRRLHDSLFFPWNCSVSHAHQPSGDQRQVAGTCPSVTHVSLPTNKQSQARQWASSQWWCSETIHACSCIELQLDQCTIMLAQLQLDAQALGCPTSPIEFCKSVDLPDQHFLAYGAGAGLVGIAICQVSAMEASVLHHEPCAR